MIEVILDDRLGKKVRVKCNEDDTIGDLKKLAAAQVRTKHSGWMAFQDSTVSIASFTAGNTLGKAEDSKMVHRLQGSYYFG